MFCVVYTWECIGLHFNGRVVFAGTEVPLYHAPVTEQLGFFYVLFLSTTLLFCVCKRLACVPSIQLLHVPLPADGSRGPPRRHALGALRDVPTVPAVGQEPSFNQQPVAVDLRRHGPQGQPAGGPVLQRLPAVLRAGSFQDAAPGPGVQVRRMTALPQS